MAAFVKDVMDSTAEIDPKKQQKAQEAYQRMAENIQKQFGGQQTAGTPTLGLGSNVGAEQATAQSQADEFKRREAAAGNAYSLASKIDTRKSAMSDEINAAIKRRKLLEGDSATKQTQMNRESDLGLHQLGQQTGQQMKELAFTSYKSQAERNQAMKELYNKGALDKQLADAALSNALKQQDIDSYFKMVESKLKADFNDALQSGEMGFETWKRNVQAQAANTASIINGAATIASASMQAYKQSPSSSSATIPTPTGTDYNLGTSYSTPTATSSKYGLGVQL